MECSIESKLHNPLREVPFSEFGQTKSPNPKPGVENRC